MYEIVVRAEAILAEELTPSSRLATHALFLAYDEILPEYDLDPSERHISKLVFMVGGVKGYNTLMDKFKHVMAQMNITLAIEGPQDSGDEQGHPLDDYANNPNAFKGQRVGGNVKNAYIIDDDGYTSNTRTGDDESDGYKSSSDSIPEFSTESVDTDKERHLADKAAAFRRSHYIQLSAVPILRRWHNVSSYVDNLCAQAESCRDEALVDGICDRFRTWRALAVVAAGAAPDKVPPNIFSKRTERIAIRAHEIYLIKKTIAKWRHSTQIEARKRRDAKLLGDRQTVQEWDGEDFKENSQLARLAQRAHRNLVMSRAFSAWSNRAEEEAAKSGVAAKAYEMGLKVKALGFSRKGSAMDIMRRLLVSKTSGPSDAPISTDINTAPKRTVTTSMAEAIDHEVPKSAPELHTLPSRPSSNMATMSGPETRTSGEPHPISSTVRPATVIPTVSKPPPVAPTSVASCAASIAASSMEPRPPDKTVEETEVSDNDQLDERTMLARRHILRMRYFGAWEKHTGENITRVEQFEEERQRQRLKHSVSTWRSQVASARQQVAERKIDFEEINSYERATKAVSKWRERTSREHRRGQTLQDYAERAKYYQRATKAIPILREKAEQAGQKEKLLGSYAERTNYYLRTTQALSAWRERAQDVSQLHQLQQYYGERADYYYRTRDTLIMWEKRAKRKRKERLREAHLATRRIVKRGMGERCIKKWRNKLEPSYERYEIMNVALAEAIEDREWRQTSQALNTWRLRAQEHEDAITIGDDMLVQKALVRWQEKTALQRDMQAEASEHWDIKLKSRALKKWNLSSLQSANRPEMVANALEKKERRLLRQGFETWYGRTADKLVPVQLPNGAYMNVGQVVEGARRRATEDQARNFMHTWRATANSRAQEMDDVYAPTPGRPRLLLGSFGRIETTTPLAPVPSRSHWQGRDSTMGRSDFTARASRSERPKNLRVSWAP